MDKTFNRSSSKKWFTRICKKRCRCTLSEKCAYAVTLMQYIASNETKESKFSVKDKASQIGLNQPSFSLKQKIG